MIKICFVCNWNESSQSLLERYSKQTPNGDGVWNNLIGTIHHSEADFIIMMDGANDNFDHIDSSRKIVLQREPDYIRDPQRLLDIPAIKYALYRDGYPYGVIWWINKSFKEIESLEYNKERHLSAITSSKSFLEGHTKRLNFIKGLSNILNDIDIYGDGLNKDHYRGHYLGKLDNGSAKCKSPGIYPYKYSTAIENGVLPNYFSEKICDCFLGLSMPLYYGCPNILDYFPESSISFIEDINNPHKINLKSIDLEALKEAKHLVLYKYNLWALIKRIIDEL